VIRQASARGNNQLLRIEEEMGDRALCAGWQPL